MSAASPTITLRFFGAGGAFSRRYGTTCSGLTMPSGDLWLIDCGRQAPDQLHHAGISWHDVHGQIITHVHGDHTYGVEDFAFSRYFFGGETVPSIREGGPRPQLVCHSAVRRELWESLAASLRYVPDDPAGRPAAGTLETFFEPVAPVESSPTRDNPWPHAERFDTGELRLWTRETVHVPAKPSTSLEIAVDATNDGENAAAPRVAWWSGDSTVDATSLQQLEPRTTVFFHDCTFVEYPGQVHGEFRLLEQLPANIREKVVLMHHEDDLEDHRARAESLGFRIALPGHVYDLTTGRRIA